MIDTFFGLKIDSSRFFTKAGHQVPATWVRVEPMVVIQIKNDSQDGYQALQVGVGQKKQKRGKPKAPLFLREIGVSDTSSFKKGDQINPTQVLKNGDLVSVTGISKGKGFTGVMKRWNFAGGPRTHGQSDRQRAPGSIGQTTTPGRVFKGKKMPGRAGNQRIMIKNLVVLEVDQEKGLLLIKGLLPGARNGLLEIKKLSQLQNFDSLLKPGEKLKITAEKKSRPEKDTQEKEKKENDQN
jgi:large subunit ribosomal protein L3